LKLTWSGLSSLIEQLRLSPHLFLFRPCQHTSTSTSTTRHHGLRTLPRQPSSNVSPSPALLIPTNQFPANAPSHPLPQASAPPASNHHPRASNDQMATPAPSQTPHPSPPRKPSPTQHLHTNDPSPTQVAAAPSTPSKPPSHSVSTTRLWPLTSFCPPLALFCY
jgi:hypothetical protein